MKKKFKPFAIEDLTGGLNLRDAPNEIDNKQSLECHNFNFSGNKLTNEKKEKLKNVNINGNIIGFTNDQGNIFYYSNNLYSEDGLIKGLQSISIGVIKENFKSGYNFTIIIDGTRFDVKGGSVNELLLNLYNLIDGGVYDKQFQDDLIILGRKDNNKITFEGTEDRKKVLYNFNSSDKRPGERVFWNFILDGVEYSGNYINPKGLNRGKEDIYLINHIKETINKGELVNIDTNGNIVHKYTTNAGLIIDGVNSFKNDNKGLNFYCIRNYSSYSGGGEFGEFTLLGGRTGIKIEGKELIINQSYRLSLYNSGETFTIEIDGVVSNIYGSSWGDKLKLPEGVTKGNTSTFNSSNGQAYLIARENGRKLNIKVDGVLIDLDNYNGRYVLEKGSATLTFQEWNGFMSGPGYTYSIHKGIEKTSTVRDYIMEQLRAWGYQCNEEELDGKNYGIWFWKDDFSKINIELDGGVLLNYLENGNAGPFSSTYKYPQIYNIRGEIGYEKFPEDIRTMDYISSFKIDELYNNNNSNNGIKRLAIGNKDGVLIVDRLNGGATYNYNGILANLSDDVVGKPTVGTLYNGKIVLGGYKNTDNIVFSKTSEPRHPFDLLKFGEYDAGAQSVSSGDKGEIVGFSVGENGLYVFKNNSVWYSNQDIDSERNSKGKTKNLIFRKITSNGALNQETITEVGQEIFYLDWDSRLVRRLGYEQNMQTLRDVGISKEIKPLLDKLPKEQLLATAHFKYPNYHLSLTDGTNEKINIGGKEYYPNNKHFVFNVENGAWTTMDCIDVVFSNKGFIVGRDNKIYELFKDNMESGHFLSKEYTFGDDNLMKKFGKFEISGRMNGNKELTVKIIIDGEELEYKKFKANGEEYRIREKIDLYDIGETFQFKFEYNGDGELEIYDAQIYYKGTPIEIDDYN